MASGLSKRVLIAETDEYGNVAHIWVKPKASRVPRAVRLAEIPGHLPLSADVDVVGAPRADVEAWMLKASAS